MGWATAGEARIARICQIGAEKRVSYSLFSALIPSLRSNMSSRNESGWQFLPRSTHPRNEKPIPPLPLA